MAEVQTLTSGTNAQGSPTEHARTPTPSLTRPSEPSSIAGSLSPRKRRRSSKPTPLRETRPAPGSASSKTLLSSSPSPRAITGAAALSEGRHGNQGEQHDKRPSTSPNSAREALNALSAATNAGMSRLDEGAKRSPSELVQFATSGAKSPLPARSDDADHSEQASPRSLPLTFHSVQDSSHADHGATLASPHRLSDGLGDDPSSPHHSDHARSVDGASHEDEARSNKAFTFPGPLGLQPHRTASLPNSGYNRDHTSSSGKRHKCPYCNTDFTRHHNLKSHLLTHSQEKPFSCDRCDSRFRRLHDLKRHAKLHTGERPHVCPKCERSFARGDALARHNKGQGGCAGRRESVGSFAGDDRHEEGLRANDTDSMAGILYTNEASHEPENMDEDTEAPTERDVPRIAKHESPREAHQQLVDQQDPYQARQPSTYPPVVARPPVVGQLYPPPPPLTSPHLRSAASTSQSSLNHYPPPSSGSSTYQTSAANVFTQAGGMTESPKPLSPGVVNAHQPGHSDTSLSRHRSPSISQNLPHAHYRRPTGHNTSPPVSLPPPHTGSNLSSAPHLPPLQNLNPPEARFTLHSHSSGSLGGPPPPNNTTSYQAGHTSSGSSHGTGRHGSLEIPGLQAIENERLWTQINSMNSKIQRLEEELTVLRAQRSAQQSR